MRILISTYANRGVTTMGVGLYYNKIADVLEKEGHELIFFNHPTPLVVDKISFNKTFLPMFSGVFSKEFAKAFEKTKPDAVHIQPEVGLGISARSFCVNNAIPYSGSYHTNWDIGMKYWMFLPPSLVWSYLRWFYEPAAIIHVGTQHLKDRLIQQGFKNTIEPFPLGVDTNNFYYDPSPTLLSDYPRPYFMTLSRIAKEKNIEAFLDLDLPGTKFVIGDGPHKKYLQRKYAGKAVFFPYENVRKILSEGDVFVFASRFDTFGLTNLEALACGLPIAAFPVMGPMDIIKQGITGFVSENLQEAALACLSLKKQACIEQAKQFNWEHTAHEFLRHQILIK